MKFELWATIRTGDGRTVDQKLVNTKVSPSDDGYSQLEATTWNEAFEKISSGSHDFRSLTYDYGISKVINIKLRRVDV